MKYYNPLDFEYSKESTGYIKLECISCNKAVVLPARLSDGHRCRFCNDLTRPVSYVRRKQPGAYGGKTMTRKQRITYLEIKLQNPDLTLSSRIRDEATLRDLRYIDELEHRHKSLQGAYQRLAERGLEKGQKYCYRYGQPMVMNCEVCESCLQPGDLAWEEEA